MMMVMVSLQEPRRRLPGGHNYYLALGNRYLLTRMSGRAGPALSGRDETSSMRRGREWTPALSSFGERVSDHIHIGNRGLLNIDPFKLYAQN